MRRRRASPNVFEQIGWMDLEAPSKPDDCEEARVSAGPLQQRDLGAMQVGCLAERFLRHASSRTSLAKIFCELLDWLHREDGAGAQTKRLQTKPRGSVRVARAMARNGNEFTARDVGARIAEARRERGLTQEQLAALAPFFEAFLTRL
jgi:hypothetical protein